MYALKRIFAYLIDYANIFLSSLIVVKLLSVTVFTSVPPHLQAGLSIATWGLSLLLPTLLLGIMTGLTGRTPGKLLMFLRVQDHGEDPPGIVQRILREVIKVVSLGFFLGIFLALQAVVNIKPTYYDDWFNLEVEDLLPYGLTETQKNYRKVMKEKQRRERRRCDSGGSTTI